MKILTFAASLRKDSFNRKLISEVNAILRTLKESELDPADFKDFEMPIYDGDLEQNSGIPQGAKEFIRRISSANALVISTPEYNGGIPGSLKNAIDWVSRNNPNPINRKPVLLLGASPGALGAVRGLWHTRVPFEAMGAFVFPEMFGLPRANQAFDEGGKLLDPKNRSKLEDLLRSFIQFSNDLIHE